MTVLFVQNVRTLFIWIISYKVNVVTYVINVTRRKIRWKEGVDIARSL